MQDSTFIGLDVHKATISVAVAQGERGGEVRHLRTVAHQPDHVRKLVDKLAAGRTRLHFFYEAAPCDYGLHRQLVEMGHDCIVVAPSLIPTKAGDRVKTDRRDAVMVAKLHRAGELTAVWVPTKRTRRCATWCEPERRPCGWQPRRASTFRGSCCAMGGSIPGRRAGREPIGAGLRWCAFRIRRSRSSFKTISTPFRTPKRGWIG